MPGVDNFQATFRIRDGMTAGTATSNGVLISDYSVELYTLWCHCRHPGLFNCCRQFWPGRIIPTDSGLPTQNKAARPGSTSATSCSAKSTWRTQQYALGGAHRWASRSNFVSRRESPTGQIDTCPVTPAENPRTIFSECGIQIPIPARR
jgi:hypothetical protein